MRGRERRGGRGEEGREERRRAVKGTEGRGAKGREGEGKNDLTHPPLSQIPGYTTGQLFDMTNYL